MGFKASMIIIHRPSTALSEEVVLKHLELKDLAFRETTTMESCLYPGDKSVSIGHYNDSIIICEDYLLSNHLEITNDPVTPAAYEQTLSTLFPGSEILTIACHCSVNYHLYSLVRDGRKLRFKRVVGSGPVLEYGARLEEEELIYADSKVIEGRRMFDGRWRKNAHHITEDQLMEDFAFGVAKRHLGVKISSGEEMTLMQEVPFKKFVKTAPVIALPAKKRPFSHEAAIRAWWKIW